MYSWVSPSVSFPRVFYTKTLWIPLPPPYALHAPPISIFSIISPAQYWEVQIIKLLIMKFSPIPCYLVPLWPIYSPQHPILKPLQPTFLPQRPSSLQNRKYKKRPVRFLLYHPVYVLVLTHLKETFSMYVRVIKLIE
jgi:hypothetical protein